MKILNYVLYIHIYQFNHIKKTGFLDACCLASYFKKALPRCYAILFSQAEHFHDYVLERNKTIHFLITPDSNFSSFSLLDSTHIVDCKLKLILGLIWTLILHYSISLPMWEGEDDSSSGGQGPTPKQR